MVSGRFRLRGLGGGARSGGSAHRPAGRGEGVFGERRMVGGGGGEQAPEMSGTLGQGRGSLELGLQFRVLKSVTSWGLPLIGEPLSTPPMEA